MRMRHHWQADPDVTGSFARASAALSLLPGHGLAGKTLQAAEPVWLDNLARADEFLRRGTATAAGLRGAIALPLIVRGRTVGVIECFTRAKLRADPELRDLLMTVASQIGEHLQRLQTHEELEVAQARFASAFEQAPAGMALVTVDGSCLDVNPALCRLLGRSHEALVGSRLRELHATRISSNHPALRADGRRHARQLRGRAALRRRGRRRRLDACARVAHARLRRALLHRPRPGRHGSASLGRAAGAPRTRARALECRAERFAHVAAHELRAPLARSAGSARCCCAASARARRTGAHAAALIVENARSGGRFLDNLLAYARAGAVRRMPSGSPPACW